MMLGRDQRERVCPSGNGAWGLRKHNPCLTGEGRGGKRPRSESEAFWGYPLGCANGGSQNPNGQGPCARQGRSPLVRLPLYWAYYGLPDGSQNGYQIGTKRFPIGYRKVPKMARFPPPEKV